MRRFVKGIMTAALSFMVAGCASSMSPVEHENQHNLISDKRMDEMLKEYRPQKQEAVFSVENESVGSLLKKLSSKYGVVYILKGGDIRLRSSVYKVRTLSDLAKYVESTTDYKLVVDKPSYRKNGIAMVRLVKKDGERKSYVLIGKTTLFKALSVLAQDGVDIHFGPNVRDTNIVASVNTGDISNYINSVCDNANVWCEYNGKTLNVEKTKRFFITSPVKGKVVFSIGGGSSSGSGSSMGSEGGSSSGQGGATGGQSSGGTQSRSLSYSIENISFAEFIASLEERLKVKFIPSTAGFLMLDATPREYKLVSSYFNELKARKTPVYLNIQLLRIDLKNQYKYGVDWNEFGSLLVDRYKFVTGQTFIPASLNEGGVITVLNRDDASEKGIIRALKDFGNVHKVDSVYTQIMTGSVFPFANYKLVRYFTIGSESTNSGTSTTAEVNTDEVGFKGSLTVNKAADGYYIDGAIELSAIDGFITIAAQGIELKAPQISGKVIRINTKLNSLGKTIIVGGFRTKGIQNAEKAVPILGEMPAFEYLFSGKDNLEENSEFVILITLEKPRTGEITRSPSSPVVYNQGL